MKLILSVIFVLIVPNGYLSQESKQFVDAIANNFVFPKDRHNPLSTRIIGGEEVTPHAYAFQTALVVIYGKDMYFCGGTLIKPNWILTAAHCVERNPDTVMVFLGTHYWAAADRNNILNGTKIVVHQKWDSKKLLNDIALVKLPRNVTLNENIKTVTYATGNSSYSKEKGTILGWGVTDAGVLSAVLRRVNSTILTNEECKAIYPFETTIAPSHICTSGEGIVGSCNGDSGGPLLVDGVQVGIVSFGTENCTLGKPTAFTRVTEFHDWILEHAVDSSPCQNIGLTFIMSTAFLIYLFNFV